jgi:hypothetical protein
MASACSTLVPCPTPRDRCKSVAVCVHQRHCCCCLRHSAGGSHHAAIRARVRQTHTHAAQALLHSERRGGREKVPEELPATPMCHPQHVEQARRRALPAPHRLRGSLRRHTQPGRLHPWPLAQPQRCGQSVAAIYVHLLQMRSRATTPWRSVLCEGACVQTMSGAPRGTSLEFWVCAKQLGLHK